ncbi:MAG: A24 family peptidase [Chloroflexota bacterium]
MTTLIFLLILLVGWLVGIWVNHAGTVIPAKETIWQPPYYRNSKVRKPVSAWSGITAYLSGTYRCPQTGQSIGIRPPLVELSLAILFLFLSIRYSISIYFVFLLLYTTILALLTVTDLEHRLIQNIIILPALLIGVVGSFFSPNISWRQALLGGALAFIIFYVLAILARGGLGSGDVTLSAFLGVIIGFPNIVFALTFGVLLGGIVSALLVIARVVTLKTFIPYGPFLIFTGWAVLIWGEEIRRYML